jgi:hypothetical protein
MAITYTWTIKELYVIDTDVRKDYVVSAVYSVTATNGKTSTSITKNQPFKVLSDDSKFKKYSNLTNDIVIGWIKDELGNKQVKVIENNLDPVIRNKETPVIGPVKKPLPF